MREACILRILLNYKAVSRPEVGTLGRKRVQGCCNALRLLPPQNAGGLQTAAPHRSSRRPTQHTSVRCRGCPSRRSARRSSATCEQHSRCRRWRSTRPRGRQSHSSSIPTGPGSSASSRRLTPHFRTTHRTSSRCGTDSPTSGPALRCRSTPTRASPSPRPRATRRLWSAPPGSSPRRHSGRTRYGPAPSPLRLPRAAHRCAWRCFPPC